jgi:hypothetical protein
MASTSHPVKESIANKQKETGSGIRLNTFDTSVEVS